LRLTRALHDRVLGRESGTGARCPVLSLAKRNLSLILTLTLFQHWSLVTEHWTQGTIFYQTQDVHPEVLSDPSARPISRADAAN